ncbi:MAG: RDD family protein [Deltaproteobacteria bacterium]|nr:RDD family protein [Deltaproteobacteria bacterium]
MLTSGRLMAQLIDTQLEVGTPEHLAFRARIAGPARRIVAYALDLLVRFFALVTLAILGNLAFGSLGLDGVATGVLLAGWFALDWGYYFACELLTGGRSPGKMALKLRVVRTNGLPITWRESLLRNLARAADVMFLPSSSGVTVFGLGLFVMTADRKFRRTGDLLAGTIVVIEESTRVNTTPVLTASPELLDELPLTMPFDRTEMEALELFVNRQQMSAERREELAEIIAPVLAKRLHVPEPRQATLFLASIWARAQDPHRRLETPS